MGLGGELSRLELGESEEGRPVWLHWGNALQRQAGMEQLGVPWKPLGLKQRVCVSLLQLRKWIKTGGQERGFGGSLRNDMKY